MKQYILGLTMAAALTFTVSGCSDFLDEPILGQQDMENYFSTEYGAQNEAYKWE